MIRRIALLTCACIVLLGALSSELEAQRTLAVAVGSRVRVQTLDDSTWRVGRLTGVAPDTLRLRSCDSCAVDTYLLPSLSAVQVSVGRKGSTTTIFKGAFLGTLAGLGSGWLYARIKTRSCRPSDDLCGLEYLAVPFAGAGGLFIGMAIGSLYRYDDWRPALIR